MIEIKDMIIDEFQNAVSGSVVSSKSILDQMSRYQDCCTRVSRSVVKAVTQCGCISIQASKQNNSQDKELEEIQNLMKTHLSGKLCNDCQEAVEKEIGKSLYYITSLCSTLDLNIYDIMINELDRLRTLGRFNIR